MAEITLNGLRVTSLSLALPRVGAWTADVAVDTDTELTGAVGLAVDTATWAGSVVRGAVYAGSWRGRIVGAPGLLATVAPTALQGATLAVVLAGVLGGHAMDGGGLGGDVDAGVHEPLQRWGLDGAVHDGDAGGDDPCVGGFRRGCLEVKCCEGSGCPAHRRGVRGGGGVGHDGPVWVGWAVVFGGGMASDRIALLYVHASRAILRGQAKRGVPE